MLGDISDGSEASWGGVEIALTTDLLMEIMDPRTVCRASDNDGQWAGEDDKVDHDDTGHTDSGGLGVASNLDWHYQLEGPRNNQATMHAGTMMRGNSCVISIERIGPNESVEVVIPIRMRPEAGNVLMAEQVYAWLEANHPEALGPVNPHNAEIEALFGDQGGH